MSTKVEKQEIYQLLDKYLADTLSPEEALRLRILLQDGEEDAPLTDVLQQLIAAQPADPHYDATRWNDMIASIVQPRPIRKLPYRWLAAAVVAGIAALSLFFWQWDNQKPVVVAQADLPPGADRAVLTLADGRRVELDSAGNTTLNEGDVALTQHGGQLTYEGGHGNGALVYNTLSTPRGGQFRIVLPDGTKVWLNAASSLKYPTTFAANERRVMLTGEGFFEVAADEQHPFHVQVAELDVTVLGTQFNVNAYQNESGVKATLLQGAIAVGAAGRRVVLKPRQQASIDGDIQVNDHVDVNAVVAWKNGAFNLEGASLREVMRQLERWYDIEVVYQGQVPDIYFTGKISRRVKLSSVLKALEEWGVNFRMEAGNRLVVLP